MASDEATTRLEEFATSLSYPDLTVRRAAAAIDERQDGELVTRVILLLDDPEGETWGVDRVRELRQALGREATELGLPSVSLTLVPQSEAEFIGPFAR